MIPTLTSNAGIFRQSASAKLDAIALGETSKALLSALEALNRTDTTSSISCVGNQKQEHITQAPRSIAEKPVSELLYDTLALFKIQTASVAMHLPKDWRDRFFKQLDSLLDPESWDAEDAPPALASFSTLLRMLILLGVTRRRPGLGATSGGHLIAAWTVGDNRLTIECLPDDRVKWMLLRMFDETRERAAGETGLARLHKVLGPYSPSIWFDYADNVSRS